MSAIDPERLLQEIDAEQPCGENLEYDAAFTEMEQASQGKAEQVMGDSVVPAEEPDWKKVRNNALELFGRTKDLRVALYLARSAVGTGGLVDLSRGLSVIQGLIDQHWDRVHPELDPDDDNDPTMRVNVIAALCDGDTLLREVRETPMVSSRAMGRFSLRDFQIATGQLSPREGTDPPDVASIDAAFMDCELEELQATTDAVDASVESVAAIEVSLTEKVGAAQAADLSDLGGVLKEIRQVLGERLERRGVVGAAEGGAEMAAGGETAAPAAQRLAGEVTSREDVVRALDKCCDYFVRNEPSSPVPLLLQRAKRLVSANFMEIIRDLAPDGVDQAEAIRGPHGGEGELE